MGARRALVEVYRRITDYPTPVCVVRELAPAIDLLDDWIQAYRPHVRKHPR
jgi:hypothetical protein